MLDARVFASLRGLERAIEAAPTDVAAESLLVDIVHDWGFAALLLVTQAAAPLPAVRTWGNVDPRVKAHYVAAGLLESDPALDYARRSWRAREVPLQGEDPVTQLLMPWLQQRPCHALLLMPVRLPAARPAFARLYATQHQSTADYPTQLALRALLEAFVARLEQRVEREAAATRSLLSPRQVRILHLASSGHTVRDIADEVCLSEAAVRYHRAQIQARLGANCWEGAIARAAHAGLLIP